MASGMHASMQCTLNHFLFTYMDPTRISSNASFLTYNMTCHHHESITSVTLRRCSHSCHSDVVLSVGVQPVQDHIPLVVPVTDQVLAGNSSRVVHLQRRGSGEGGEGRGSKLAC